MLSLLFTTDGQTLISSSADRTIRIWAIATGDCIALDRHHHWVWALSQHSIEQILLSSSQDETINAWSLDGTHLKTLRCARPYEGTLITGATGLTEAQAITFEALGAVNKSANSGFFNAKILQEN